MKKTIKYPSIGQFREVVTNVNKHFTYIGLDDNGDAVYDDTIPKPTISFKGTVKLHGTNASICFNNIGGFWVQSRENIITPTSDNAGFAFFAESKKDILIHMCKHIAKFNKIDLDNNTVSIYGEWVGKGIQKGVGICNLPKSFFIFGAKVTPHCETEEELKANPSYWVVSSFLRSLEDRIYNIEDYQQFFISVDFNDLQSSQDKLAELTIDVEKECPVAKSFGYSGVGEGIVWVGEFEDSIYRFKIKGEKHSTSKVKVLASVDTEKLDNIKEFVDYAVTENRFNQALENIFPNNEPIDVKKLGDVLRWVVNDIIKEEMDTMVKNNIEPKEVNKFISEKTRKMFFNLKI